MQYIKRDLEHVVLQASEEYPAVIITGSRQIGKTTMLQKLMKGTTRNYVTLDDLTERALAQNDPEMFLQLHKPPILIDEVQYAPQLFTYIKIHADRNQRPGDFWMTGSQSFKLMKLAGESLVGRACILHMCTMSQNELYGNGENLPFTLNQDALQMRIATHTPADTPAIYERIFRGSMPALTSGHVSNRNLFYSSYLQTYIERDIRELDGDIESVEFLRFITAVACRTGQMVNYADIGNDMGGMRSEKVQEWLGLLEKSDIIFYLHPYSNNLLKRTVSKPKLYFYDTGLVAYLTRWSSPETLEAGALNGAILENYTVSEILKTYYNSGEQPLLNYYRDNDAKEIDIVMESDGSLHPMEIKKTSNPGTELTRPYKLLDKGSVPRGKGAILCMKDKLSAIDSENYVVPIWGI